MLVSINSSTFTTSSYYHLDKSIHQLQQHKFPWKQVMHTALHAGRRKLSHYYSVTEHVPGNLYMIASQ